jgi:RimJ/RimL family protein N-acetyltransferase
LDLIGERVRLRAHTEEDANFFTATLADPEVVRFLADWARGPYPVSQAQAFLRNPEPNTVGWTIDCIADGQAIGTTGLHEINHRNRNCMWGIWIGPPDRWGQGFGTEACRLSVAYAFTHLGMEKVSLHVYEGNDRGRRVYETAGFTREGLLRRHMWLNGKLADVEIMSVFRDNAVYSGGATPGTE